MLPKELRERLEADIKHVEHPRELAVDVMFAVQEHYGYLSDEALAEAASMLGMTPLELDELATFYTFTFREPVGKYVIHVCDSVVCWMNGYPSVRDYLCRRLAIGMGEKGQNLLAVGDAIPSDRPVAEGGLEEGDVEADRMADEGRVADERQGLLRGHDGFRHGDDTGRGERQHRRELGDALPGRSAGGDRQRGAVQLRLEHRVVGGLLDDAPALARAGRRRERLRLDRDEIVQIEFERERDILDVWFDSGSSHEAVLAVHPELRWPADLYLEGTDQYRGWFQSSLLVGLGTRGRAPYHQVVTHGFYVTEAGTKKRASIHVVRGAAALEQFARGGLDAMAITEADVQTRLHALIDPNTGKDFVTGKAVKKIQIGAGDIVIDVQLGYPAKTQHEILRKLIAQDVAAFQQSQALGSNFIIMATARPGQTLDALKTVEYVGYVSGPFKSEARIAGAATHEPKDLAATFARFCCDVIDVVAPLVPIVKPQLACFEAGVQFARAEGIIPAPEANHAVRGAIDEALRCKAEGKAETILFNLCGHGHFDMSSYTNYFAGKLTDQSYSEAELAMALAGLPSTMPCAPPR